MESVMNMEHIHTPNRAGGRPRKENHEKKSHTFGARLNAYDAMLVRANMRKSGLKASEFMRQALTHARIFAKLPRQITLWLKDIAGMSNNVNQLARESHRSGFAAVEQRLLRLAERMEQLTGYIYDYPTTVGEDDNIIDSSDRESIASSV